MRSYHSYLCEHLSDMVNINGSTVLEIGSDAELKFSSELVNAGASEVIASNLDGWMSGFDKISMGQKIVLKAIDARDIDLESNSVDIVCAAAFLEHADKFSIIRDELLRVLKPGGVAFLHGGAFYPCWQGHHVCLFDPAYHFWDETNPFLPWEHLLYEENQMHEVLVKRGITINNAKLIIQQVYHSEFNNRCSPSQIIEILSNTGLATALYKRDMFFIEILNEKDQKKIQDRHRFSSIDLYTYSVQIIIIKNKDSFQNLNNFYKNGYLGAHLVDAENSNFVNIFGK